MESLLKIIGSEIYIGSFLFSSGLEGKAYAEKLREAEELENAVIAAIEAQDADLSEDKIKSLEAEIASLEEQETERLEEDSEKVEALTKLYEELKDWMARFDAQIY
jgi:hypothetical protein